MRRRLKVGISGVVLAGSALAFAGNHGMDIENDLPRDEWCTDIGEDRTHQFHCYIGIGIKDLLDRSDDADGITIPPPVTSPSPTTTEAAAPAPSEAAAPPSTTLAPNITPGSIVVIGDSLTVGLSNNGLEETLRAKGWTDVLVDKACGRPLGPPPGHPDYVATFESCDSGKPVRPTGHEVLKDPAVHEKVAHAEAVVVWLGANDMVPYRDAVFPDSAKAMVTEIKTINPATSVYWLTVANTANAARAKLRNEAIVASGAAIIDFYSHVAVVEGMFDGVHANPAGYVMTNQLIAETVVLANV